MGYPMKSDVEKTIEARVAAAFEDISLPRPEIVPGMKFCKALRIWLKLYG